MPMRINLKFLRILTPSNMNILKIQNFRPNVGPLTPYKPPFNPINRPWDLSRSIDLVKIYILVDLELHRTYLGPIYPQGTQGTQGGPPWTHGPLWTHGPYGPWALWTLGPMDPGPMGPMV